MQKDIIHAANTPEPIGPYSQAVEFDGTLYCSGQIPVNPVTGNIPKTAEDQTHRVLANLQAVIEAAGGELKDVVKTTIFLTDLKFFASVNAIYGEYFDEKNAPARSTVQVAALPKGVLIEIDAIACLNQGRGAACLRAETHRQATQASRRHEISNRRTRNIEFRTKQQQANSSSSIFCYAKMIKPSNEGSKQLRCGTVLHSTKASRFTDKNSALFKRPYRLTSARESHTY